MRNDPRWFVWVNRDHRDPHRLAGQVEADLGRRGVGRLGFPRSALTRPDSVFVRLQWCCAQCCLTHGCAVSTPQCQRLGAGQLPAVSPVVLALVIVVEVDLAAWRSD